MKRLIILIALIAIIVLGSLAWWTNGISAINPSNKKTVVFVVQKGAGLKEISGKLETSGLINNRVIFFLYARLKKLEGKMQAGSFRLSQSMNASEIAQNLTHGTLDVWITISEGKRAEEIAEILKENMSAYDSSWLDILTSYEGYLFPDTYLIPKDANIEMIVDQMRKNFEEKYAGINTVNSKLNKSQIVTLASLIEREAITDAEKSIITGVLVNRLDAGMALQVDATIQYAKGQNKLNKKWWEPVTIEEYQSVNSSYNTYLRTGLPPGPISNPGLEALRAAALPAKTDYLYYLHDKDKIIRYAKTLQEHNANINKYEVN